MTLVIHDLKEEDAKQLDFGESKIISDNGVIKSCKGCFGCWLKTPGECIIHDGYENLGKLFSQCDRLILISECFYGCYSPFIKNVLDRSIGYIQPFFEIRNKEMHHKRRYSNKIKINLYLYGSNITEEEKITAKEIVYANAENFDATVEKIVFLNTSADLRGEKIC